MTGDPSIPRVVISCVEDLNDRKRRLEGSESEVLSDLMDLIPAHDPELIIASYADTWIQLMVDRARRYDLEASLSCTGFFKPVASKSYCSYGQVKHKGATLIP